MSRVSGATPNTSEKSMFNLSHPPVIRAGNCNSVIHRDGQVPFEGILAMTTKPNKHPNFLFTRCQQYGHFVLRSFERATAYA